MRTLLRHIADPVLNAIALRVAKRLAAAQPPPAPVLDPPGDPGRDTALAWGLKLYGSRLAREAYAQSLAPLLAEPPGPPPCVPLTSKLCEQADIESPWFAHWCRELRMAPIYHRKVWEECYALQAIWEAGLMQEGTRALVFGAGEEPLPSYLAARGVEVLATDLAPEKAAAAGWVATREHATPERLFRKDLVDRVTFDRRVAFRHVDMNAIPDDLDGRFDIVWSLCSLEHVGSTELACAFVERAMRCLKPGGLAIHTTEFNLSSETETVTSGWCVLFTRPQIEALAARLSAQGDEVAPVAFSAGTRPLDQFVDLPPFPRTTLTWESPNQIALPEAPHMKLALMGFVTTSIGLIVRRGGAA